MQTYRGIVRRIVDDGSGRGWVNRKIVARSKSDGARGTREACIARRKEAAAGNNEIPGCGEISPDREAGIIYRSKLVVLLV